MTGPLKVLICDDNDRFRAGLRSLVDSADGTEVAGEAVDGKEAVRMAGALQPDIVLMDIKMPVCNGIDATRTIMQTSPHIGILMLTMLDDDDSVFEAMRAGARGYLLKGALKAEILRAIAGVSSGEAIFGPAIARRMMQYFSVPRPSKLEQAYPELTIRERQILELVAAHRTNPEISRELGLTVKTVRNHLSNIFNKLQIASRAEAIARAREAESAAE